MAGIGFELKHLFRKKGLFASFRAYGYAGIICTGPMLLGVLLLLGVMFLCGLFGAGEQERELLVCMITYTLLASLLVTSFFSMAVTRFLADMLYEEKPEAVLPSFWGSNSIMLAAGELLYGMFLLVSGASLLDGILCLWLFGELIVVWNAMSYLTAIKDYRGILTSFSSAVLVTFLIGFLLLLWGLPAVEALLCAVSVGYGVMLLWDVVLLYQYFPESDVRPFLFLRWVDQFQPLAFTGLLLNVGLFSHLVIMWAGPIRVQVKGLFYGAPYYDVPALMAFMTILVTTIHFVVSVEVNFYPKYRTYYSLFNDKGSIKDIRQAEKEMLEVLNGELRYTAYKQLFMTALCICFGGIVLDYLPLGFNDLMHGYFRILCVGYGLYAVGNTVLLILLYFTDYQGALSVSAVFAACSALFTGLSLLGNPVYFGFGFLAAGAVFFLLAVLRLDVFTRRLPYHILSVQPVVAESRSGMFSRFGEFLENKMGEKEEGAG
ncbi:MAG: exopolysaccharide Pel transporter PelG [Lachnospiraceae bacterium]|nr:exopolysaccharide Pel transporter PelG [Lachnospiraceae bacterium]